MYICFSYVSHVFCWCPGTIVCSVTTAAGVQKTHLPQVLLNGNNIAMVTGPSRHQPCINFSGETYQRMKQTHDNALIH